MSWLIAWPINAAPSQAEALSIGATCTIESAVLGDGAIAKSVFSAPRALKMIKSLYVATCADAPLMVNGPTCALACRSGRD